MQHYVLKDNAYRVIKKKILSLEIKPGSRIREDQLAVEIEMSRTPVREAINQLAADGYVVNVPRKGVFCIDLTQQEIREILDVREVLEVLAIKKCIDRIDDGKLEHLEEVVNEFEAELDKKNYEGCNELDSRFHKEIARITGNARLIKFITEVENLLHIARSMELKKYPQEKHETAFKGHKAMLECIRNRDKRAAEKAVLDHIKSMKANLEIS